MDCEPGDVVFLDCTSGDPERQFRAWSDGIDIILNGLLIMRKKYFLA